MGEAPGAMLSRRLRRVSMPAVRRDAACLPGLAPVKAWHHDGHISARGQLIHTLSLFTMRHELVMPELGLDEGRVTISLWLVEVGDAVTEGDRVVELLSDSVTVDLPAPASGVLTEMLVTEDDPVQTGQVLCVIESQGE